MKPLAISNALKKLAEIRESFRRTIVRGYEQNARDCSSCETQGVCCTDEHFVNVRVTSLEGEAIGRAVSALPEGIRTRVIERNQRVLSSIDTSGSDLYSCPLFEPGIGCLVHREAKPLPCINHACYDSKEDLPPAELLDAAERQVAVLNNRTYGFGWTLEVIPFWLKRLAAGDQDSRSARTP